MILLLSDKGGSVYILILLFKQQMIKLTVY